MTQDTQSEARHISALAGINVPDERLAALAAGLALNRRLMRPLLTIDLGGTEPAARFHPPAGR